MRNSVTTVPCRRLKKAAFLDFSQGFVGAGLCARPRGRSEDCSPQNVRDSLPIAGTGAEARPYRNSVFPDGRQTL